ncbi:MAG TPA: hypothetical protein PK467_03860, partial [Candidatus Wallbacteria bacterium]|nr:hypothetical protein [Candidatus Wallbacteria bacterium]
LEGILREGRGHWPLAFPYQKKEKRAEKFIINRLKNEKAYLVKNLKIIDYTIFFCYIMKKVI